MIANTEGFRSPSVLVLSRIYLAIPLNLIALAIIKATGSSELFYVSTIISASRLLDLTGEIFQSYYRRLGRYHMLVYSGACGLILFPISFFAFYSEYNIDALYSAATAFFISSFAIFLTDVWAAKSNWLRYRFLHTHRRALQTLRRNWLRGFSNLVNSMCANIPRYFLYVFVSPAAQAVYSIIVSFARIGMLGIGSVMAPRLERIRASLGTTAGVHAAMRLSLGASLLFGLPLIVAWASAVQFGLVDRFNADILRVAPIAVSSIIVASSLAVFVRFATWTIALVSVSQANQIIISLLSAMTIFFIAWPCVYYFGLTGAVLAETCGGATLIGLVYYVLKTRGPIVDVRGRHDVRVRERVVIKLSPRPAEMAEKYNLVAGILSGGGFSAPRALYYDNRSVVLEKLELGRSLRDVFLSYHKDPDKEPFALQTMQQAGRALARVHDGLIRTGELWRPPPLFAYLLGKRLGADFEISRLPTATLHGDFTFTNVYLRDGENSPSLCVIDPCPNGGSTFRLFERAPVYVDIGLFVACLHGQVSFVERLKMLQSRQRAMIDAFIQGYSAASGIEIDRNVAVAFGYAAVGSQFDYRYGLAGGLRLHALFKAPYRTQQLKS